MRPESTTPTSSVVPLSGRCGEPAQKRQRAARARHSPRPPVLLGPEGPATLLHIVGARPNWVKMAPIISALERRAAFRQLIVHTDAGHEAALSAEDLRDAGLAQPDRYLGVSSGSHGEQTGKILAALEEVLVELRPVAVVTAGDVNSTLGAALAAAKLGVPVAHVDAGLRSGDWSMPEEINRILIDRLSDLLFTHSPEALDNLAAEGIDASFVHQVGNTLIDTLRRCEPRARRDAAWSALGLREREYVLVSLHRPCNVDDEQRLTRIADALIALSAHCQVVTPIHPRTRARMSAHGDLERLEAAGVRCIPPQSYIAFLSLQVGAGAVVTDAGGVQEETSALGVACFTFRPHTERPVTLTHGTNVLLGDDPAEIASVRPAAWWPTPSAIPLWDGHAGERVADVLVAHYALVRAEGAGT